MQSFSSSEDSETHYQDQLLWGEIDQRRFGDASLLPNGDLHLEFSQITVEGPSIFQPITTHEVGFAFQKDTHIQNEYVIAGLRLLDFKKDVDSLQENLLTGAVAGEIPKLPPKVQPRTAFVQSNDSDGEPIPLSPSLARNLMQNAVAAISAFSGYDQSTDEALDILTDASCKFMKKFCKLLRVSRDNQLLGNSSGFSDVMERTYRDLGLGSVLDVREFYRDKVVGRYQSLRNDCETIWENCQILARASDGVFSGVSIDQSNQFTTIDSDQFLNIGGENYPIIDIDPFSNADNIPEIHFPSSEDGTYSFDHNTPQMEHGMQMLQSLEQGTFAAMED